MDVTLFVSISKTNEPITIYASAQKNQNARLTNNAHKKMEKIGDDHISCEVCK
jgi:hypothetical protein